MFELIPTNRRNAIALTLIYFFAHGMLLVASGRWWDSWLIYGLSDKALYNFSMELGRPSLIVTLGGAKLLPEIGYRWITFFMMYWCIFFSYKTLKNWLTISDENCFWICALYAVIPAYDARICLAVFPYTVGLFSFMAGLCYFSGSINQERLLLKNRIISYLLFSLGFTLHSTLCFYGIVWLIIVMKKGIRSFSRYLDFVLLPFIFFVIKVNLFPTYGGYANYNAVSLDNIVKGVFMIISADFHVMRRFLYDVPYAFDFGGNDIQLVLIAFSTLFIIEFADKWLKANDVACPLGGTYGPLI